VAFKLVFFSVAHFILSTAGISTIGHNALHIKMSIF